MRLSLIIGISCLAMPAFGQTWSIAPGCNSDMHVSSDGTCITEGTGAYANSETCSFTLNVGAEVASTEWAVESGFDYITVAGTQQSASFATNTFAAGTEFSWHTDGSVTMEGWTLCATPMLWTVAPGCNSDMHVSSDGTCITEGPGAYGNSETCTFTLNVHAEVASTEWAVENYFDHITVDGTTNSASFATNTFAAGTDFSWHTDGSVTMEGWTLCATPTWSVAPGCNSDLQVTPDGNCITEGPGLYGNSEDCTFTLNAANEVASTEWAVENGFDYITVAGTTQSASFATNTFGAGTDFSR